MAFVRGPEPTDAQAYDACGDGTPALYDPIESALRLVARDTEDLGAFALPEPRGEGSLLVSGVGVSGAVLAKTDRRSQGARRWTCVPLIRALSFDD